MVQLWGDKTTEQHLTCGWVGGSEVGGHKAVGAAHSGIVIREVGGWWDAADKVWRDGSFLQVLPSGSLDTEHSHCRTVVKAGGVQKGPSDVSQTAKTHRRSKFHKCVYAPPPRREEYLFSRLQIRSNPNSRVPSDVRFLMECLLFIRLKQSQTFV